MVSLYSFRALFMLRSYYYCLHPKAHKKKYSERITEKFVKMIAVDVQKIHNINDPN